MNFVTSYSTPTISTQFLCRIEDCLNNSQKETGLTLKSLTPILLGCNDTECDVIAAGCRKPGIYLSILLRWHQKTRGNIFRHKCI